jgi:hypothetical protein
VKWRFFANYRAAHFRFAFQAAQRFLCAPAIFARASADIVRRRFGFAPE